MRTVTRTLILAVALVLLAACSASGGGAGESSSDEAATITVAVADTDAGPSLVGPDGHTLYVFTQDTDGTSTCTDDCAATWPPFTVEAGATVEAGEGVTGELAIIERDDGASQVTYKGMPLYFYAPDAEPGDATGQGVGDVWFIASPEGQAGAGAEPSDDAEMSDGAEPSPSYDYDY
jgi:predicted lipoprotein with Yx(FWY)xxD motif